jgi:hypothetical protein
MKKLILTAAIVLSMGIGAFAQQGEGAFRRGGLRNEERLTTPSIPNLPSQFGSDDDEPGAPIGSGIAVLMGLGAAYMVAKKRKED